MHFNQEKPSPCNLEATWLPEIPSSLTSTNAGQRQPAMRFTISSSVKTQIHNTTMISLRCSMLGMQANPLLHVNHTIQLSNTRKQHNLQLLQPAPPKHDDQKLAFKSNFREIQTRKHRNATSINLTQSKRTRLFCWAADGLVTSFSTSMQQSSQGSISNVGI